MASNADSSTLFLKNLVDSSNLKDVPSAYKYINDDEPINALSSDSLPVVDFSTLNADDPDQRAKAIRDLIKACEEWSFFILVNHGMGEELMNAAFAAIKEFMDLGADEKKQYEANLATDPIKCGGFHTVVAGSNQNMITFWRDKLKLHVHPKFHCPHKPLFLREIVQEYSEKSREISRKLVGALSNAMELEQDYVDEALGLESSFQIFAANYYPPCPQPDEAIGIPPHTDQGLLTLLLIHNGVPGLQIKHNGSWFKINSPKNSLLVIVADNLESFSNGRYKALKHRALVNEIERMSIVSGYGLSKEAVVGPAAPLVERDGRAKYPAIKYQEYVEWLLTKSRIGAKSPLRFPSEENLAS